MAIHISKVTRSKNQYRITIPKTLAIKSGIHKAKIVEIWLTEEKIIHITEYYGKSKEKRDIPEDQS